MDNNNLNKVNNHNYDNQTLNQSHTSKMENVSSGSFVNTTNKIKNKTPKKINIWLIMGAIVAVVTGIIFVPKLFSNNSIVAPNDKSTRDGSPKYESEMLKLLDDKIYSEYGGKIDDVMYSKTISEDFVVYEDGNVHFTYDSENSKDVDWTTYPIGKNKNLLFFGYDEGIYANEDSTITAFLTSGHIKEDGSYDLILINTKQKKDNFVCGFSNLNKFNIIYRDGSKLMYAIYSEDSTIEDSGILYGAITGQKEMEITDVILTNTGLLATTKDGRVYVGTTIIDDYYSDNNVLQLSDSYISNVSKCYGDVWGRILVSSKENNELRLYEDPLFAYGELTEYTNIKLPDKIKIKNLIEVDRNRFLIKNNYYFLSDDDMSSLIKDDAHNTVSQMNGFVKFLNHSLLDKTIVLMDDGFLYEFY